MGRKLALFITIVLSFLFSVPAYARIVYPRAAVMAQLNAGKVCMQARVWFDDPSISPSMFVCVPAIAIPDSFCDADGDTYSEGEDCDDTNPDIHPGAEEYCNSVDDDCDGTTDESDAVDVDIWYNDSDGDGYGNVAIITTACVAPAGYVADTTDCDDDNASINPIASEVCWNGLDDNCNSTTDEDCEEIELFDDADAVLVGESTYDYAGIRVSGAGDVNADGFSDILVGAPHESSLRDSNFGRAYLVHGPITGEISLSSANARLIGTAEYGDAGYEVSDAGDLNADGYGDILVSSLESEAWWSGLSAVHVVYGPVTGDLNLSSTDAILIGTVAGDQAGSSIDSIGDINADGFDDIIIGASCEDSGGSQAGAAYIVLGPVLGELDMSSAAEAKLIGENSNDRAGESVSGAGDMNADGQLDVLVGAQSADSGAGAVYVLNGPIIGEFDLSFADVKLTGGGEIASVADAGDVNNDGYDDILIGATDADGVYADLGAAYLILGPVTADKSLSLADAKMDAEEFGGSAGQSVSGVGDVNHDGYDDCLVSDPGWYDADDPHYEDSDMAAYLILGPFTGEFGLQDADTRFIGGGSSVSGVGDVDADGYADFLIGNPTTDEGGGTRSGAAYLILGEGF